MKTTLKNREHKITLIAEFENKSENLVANLSKYISSIVSPKDSILTDLQAFPAGMRLTYIITYTSRNKNKYSKKLAKLSDWLYNSDSGSLSRYHYNCT